MFIVTILRRTKQWGLFSSVTIYVETESALRSGTLRWQGTFTPHLSIVKKNVFILNSQQKTTMGNITPSNLT